MKKFLKIVGFMFLGLIIFGALSSLGEESVITTNEPAEEVVADAPKEGKVAEPKEETEPKAEPKEEPEVKEEKPKEVKKEEPKKEEAKMTLAQENAISKANDYLNYTAFSKSGLVGQLEFDGFSNADATFAVENIKVDWNAQAVQKGKDYLDYSSFSRQGLIDQLVFDGYTQDQAVHAVDAIGLQ